MLEVVAGESKKLPEIVLDVLLVFEYNVCCDVVARLLLPFVLPIFIAVESRINLSNIVLTVVDKPISATYKTRILLLELVGVIETENDVISVKAPVVVDENVSVFVVLTTCNTAPA